MILDDLLIRGWFRLRRGVRARITHTHAPEPTWTVTLVKALHGDRSTSGTVTAPDPLAALRLADLLAAVMNDPTASMRRFAEAARRYGASGHYSREPGR